MTTSRDSSQQTGIVTPRYEIGGWGWNMFVVVGAFGVTVFVAVMTVLFGTIGSILATGVGIPVFLAWFYYRTDLRSRTASKVSNDQAGKV
ncbi:hypothetical protein FHS21_001322 [Phyllobacterium trifolii]|uniref:Uncharacterized protein n=2 Tax=Phyllobacterium trifolii TaxID=300193 RepID=A0A839U877_9HYPH|nr:hypothetical protein [Phyllobacterium trifolii]